MSLANGVIPPTNYGRKKLTKPVHSRLATHDSPLPNRHRMNVPLQRLPLENNMGSTRKEFGRNSPLSQRLRETQQSSFSMRNVNRGGSVIRSGSVMQGGSVYKHEGVPKGKPLINGLMSRGGLRSISTDRIDTVSKVTTMEQAAFAIISQRFGRSLSRGRAKPSNVLYNASYKPKRFMLQDWYSTVDGKIPPKVIK